jgi:hypothetical protein
LNQTVAADPASTQCADAYRGTTVNVAVHLRL